MNRIDLRSDTVTRPTAAMLDHMMGAEVGDDVFGEDPSINELEAKSASLFGMEAALFCATGTMGNQIAIKLHTQPGDEVICESKSHVYIYEGGGIAFNSGAQVKALKGDRGRMNADQILEAVNPDDVHKARTSLVCLENTSNRGGGSCYNWQDLVEIRELCTRQKLALHLDGARIFNALVATGATADRFGGLFDTISVCLSKGLGCPGGSILLGSAVQIRQARRIRKVLGGGMRQAGYFAAAGIYALDHHIERLEIDHQHARMMAAALEKKDFVHNLLPVETNLVIFEVKGRFTPESLLEKLLDKGILCLTISGSQIRLVTHLDISSAMTDQVVSIIDAL